MRTSTANPLMLDITLRDLLIANAPEHPQPWFQPVMRPQPPRPGPYIREQSPEYNRLRIDMSEDYMQWDGERERERYLQWPAARADEQLRRRARHLLEKENATD